MYRCLSHGRTTGLLQWKRMGPSLRSFGTNAPWLNGTPSAIEEAVRRVDVKHLNSWTSTTEDQTGDKWTMHELSGKVRRLLNELGTEFTGTTRTGKAWLMLTASERAFLSNLLSKLGFPPGFGRSGVPKPGQHSDQTSGSGSQKSSGGGKKEPVPDNWTSLALLALTFLGLSTFFTSSSPRGQEVSWQEFRNNYLSKGVVDRLEVINKEFVKVHLRSTPHPHFQQDSLEEEHSSTASESSQKERPKSVWFRIGSVDTFERQLEDAQLDMGIPPSKFVPVKHVSEADMTDILMRLLPTLLLIGAYFFFMNRMGGGSVSGGSGGGGGGINRVFNIGKAKPAVSKDHKVTTKFSDVAGVDEAKMEVVEFVEFLRDPSRFTKLGAKIPKGALLVGPPGTGKTLLARAVAGEAAVPFFSMSGSDFIEMFVGVGPSRVRDLFKQARESAPCIIFLDEIDAVARARGKGGFSGGNDERENTLNQLLVEMDGFLSTEGIVVLAGTNRVDILDKAILRPGRFDRQITIDRPDIKGREQIFRVYLKTLTLAGPPEDYSYRMASLTPGFTGADIANVCNEAAIVAARSAKDAVDLEDFEKAIDRVIGGLEKRNSLMTQEEKKTIAYHESGHAVAGWFLKHADPLLKVTIVPRGSGALGFAQYLPKEVTLYSKEALIDRMCMALAGRASEEVNFNQITTGASDDLDKVTQMAYGMISIYGMNDAIGKLSFPPKDEMQMTKPYSDKTATLIDDEARQLVDFCYNRVKDLIIEKKDEVTKVAELLLERETVNQNDLVQLIGPRPFKMENTFREYVDPSYKKERETGDGKPGKEQK